VSFDDKLFSFPLAVIKDFILWSCHCHFLFIEAVWIATMNYEKKISTFTRLVVLTFQKLFSCTFPANPTEPQSLKDSSTRQSAEKQDSFNHAPQRNKPLVTTTPHDNHLATLS
jgi:hypothetical protein